MGLLQRFRSFSSNAKDSPTMPASPIDSLPANLAKFHEMNEPPRRCGEDLECSPTEPGPSSGRPCYDSAGSFSIDGEDNNAALYGPVRYRYIADLNRGSSAVVQLAEDLQTGRHVAIKLIPTSSRFNARAVASELLNQRRCAGHPNIIQLQETFLTADHLCIVLEYADGGNLSEMIDALKQQQIHGLPEEDARALFQQLIVAVEACHSRGVVNRDIKLDNLMVHGEWPRPVLMMCDFGFSKDEAHESISKSTCGTPEYMAPEVLFDDSYCGQKADTWSCGVCLHLLLTGRFPFKRPSDKLVPKLVSMQRMFSRIIVADFTPVPEVSEDCQELLNSMLQPDAELRVTLGEVIASAWFQKDLPPELARLNSSLGIVDPAPGASPALSLDRQISAAATAASEAIERAAALQRQQQQQLQSGEAGQPQPSQQPVASQQQQRDAADAALAAAPAATRQHQGSGKHQLPQDAAGGGCRQTAEELLDIVAEAAVQSARCAKTVRASSVGVWAR